MRNWLLAVIVALPVSLCAQAIVNVPPEQCVYKVGDDARWAATDLDESGWTPETQYKLTGDMTVLWLRCHTNTNLAGALQPAVLISAFDSTDQAFVNGQPIGGIAGPVAGFASEETFEKEVFPLPPGLAFPVRTIAVRVAPGRFRAASPLFPVIAYTFPGDRESLVNLAVRTVDSFWGEIPVYSCFLVIGSAGLFLLGLFLFDHSQKPALWLGIYCCSVSLARVTSLCMEHAPQIPMWVDEIVWAACNLEPYALVLVIFALVNRRVPRIYWVLPATAVVLTIGVIAAILLPPHWALPLSLFVQVTCFKPMWSIFASSGTAPFVAFWPWIKQRGRMKIVAPVCVRSGGCSKPPLIWARSSLGVIAGTVQYKPGGPSPS
jgi:hypothetical protein